MPAGKKQFVFQVMWNWYVEIRERHTRHGRLDGADLQNLVYVREWAEEEDMQSILPRIAEMLEPAESAARTIQRAFRQSQARAQQARLETERRQEQAERERRNTSALVPSSWQGLGGPVLKAFEESGPVLTNVHTIVRLLDVRGKGQHEDCYFSIFEEVPPTDGEDEPWVRIYIAQVDVGPVDNDKGFLKYKFFGLTEGKPVLATAGTKIGEYDAPRKDDSSVFVNFGRPFRALKFYEDKPYTQGDLKWKISSCLVRRSVLLEIMTTAVLEPHGKKPEAKGKALNSDYDQDPNQFAVTNAQALIIQKNIKPGSLVNAEDIDGLRIQFGLGKEYFCFLFENADNGHKTRYDKGEYRFMIEFYRYKLEALHAQVLKLLHMYKQDKAEERKSFGSKKTSQLRLVSRCRVLLAAFGYPGLVLRDPGEIRLLFNQLSVFLSYYGLTQIMPAIYDPVEYEERRKKAALHEDKQRKRKEAKDAYFALVDACLNNAWNLMTAADTGIDKLSEFELSKLLQELLEDAVARYAQVRLKTLGQ
ncbi:hypothetical protein G4177_26915 [Corallococcus sp. ZKHCc1 1396]|uniref:Uncharacterized protein n=1 Tax=Corallococcus soli TaxID=2710757 RepID=A0ABR9PVK3_9BACT|nr:hypothetical protein [Corallococcus soli]MBE4751807.1 hypothetical protein [Corallococcus soli]